MKISHLIISVGLVSLIAIVLGLFIGDASKKYDFDYNNGTIQKFNQLESVYSTSLGAKDNTINATSNPDFSDGDKPYSWLSNSIDTIRLAISSFDLVGNMVIDSTDQIPQTGSTDAIQTFILLLLITGVVFALIYLVAKVYI